MNKIEVNELSPEMKVSLKTRVITAIVLAMIAFPCLFLGGYFFLGLLLVCSIFAAFEIWKLPNIQGKSKYFALVGSLVGLLAMVFSSFIWNLISQDISDFDIILYSSFNDVKISTFVVIFIFIYFYFICFFDEKFTIVHMFYFITMILIVGFGINSLLFLRNYPFTVFSGNLITEDSFKYLLSTSLVVYTIVGSFMNDIGAYFIGILFGKHKMNERISPKKTWEGFFGGLVISTLFTTLLSLLYKENLNVFLSDNLSLFICSGLLIALFSTVGDYFFSSVKRHFNVKDYGKILPGHGGILDRIDSLIFASIAVSVFLQIIK